MMKGSQRPQKFRKQENMQPGKHLSIDTRFSELSLEDSSLVAESERDPSRLPTSAPTFRNRTIHSRVQIPKGNFYITSPFKQGPEKDVKGPVLVIDPSLQLKQRTTAGVAKIKKQLERTKRTRNMILPPAQLQRGRLKALGRPVTASDPLVNNCQGILAGTRRYHGFARRRTSPSLERVKSSRVFSTSETALSAAVRPGSPSQLLRPESSIHNTSYASSVNESNSRCDFSFSEDELSDDSIDVDNQAEQVARFNQDENETKEKLLCLLTENKTLASGCKPHFDDSKKEHPDDSDEDEGRWARQNLLPANRSYEFERGRNNNSDSVRKASGGKTSTSQGKQTQLTTCGGRESKRTSSCELQNEFSVDSSMIKSCQKTTDRLHPELKPVSRKPGAEESFNNRSGLDPDKIIDVHIRVISGNGSTCVGTLDRSNNDDDEYLDGDTLDSDRIPSADILKVLDSLNLSTSAMKPRNPRNERPKVRRVQSAGYMRHTAGALREPRPPSGKRVGKRRENDKNLRKVENSNTVTSMTSRKTDDLTKSAREKLPGYFTEQYKKILDEQKRDRSASAPVKKGLPPPSSMTLVAKEITGKDSDRNGLADMASANKLGKEFVEMCRGKSSMEKTPLFSEKPDKSSNGKKSPRSSPTSVFVTMEDKSESRGFNDWDDSSSGVETMSCATGSSAYGRTIDKSNYSSELGWSSSNENLCTVTDGQRYDELDDCTDSVSDDDDDGVNAGLVEDFANDSTDLEVVAKTMTLSESRYDTKKKPIAPFPPLCFSINAKPPEGQLYYFAYGPEMNPNRMAIYLRREPKTRLWGILFGFQILFNKRGTSDEAGGFPNMEFSPRNSVEGCVYAITDTELRMLDNCMGYPKHYTRVVVPVWMLNCTSPSEHGVAQYCVPAVSYIAQDKWIVNDSSQKLECRYSVSQCLKASDILTPNYVQFLTSQATS
ncbi:hypothetical protein AWC38_SpisGene14322 [Stylophora pistillata]|uniref:Gamma-glutamylcyclotransferase AIG2-like domain-containing protein n=1 Tax=Stylophora pistillata TaxID=50429 RepID=A0A2B4RVK1_STYPI|nr:hypothetical protein AWC38_SpisGene14322 [Stylophora pistillata]